MLPGHDPEQLSVLNQERYLKVSMGQLIEDLRRRRLRSGRQQIAGHHLMHLSESVHPCGLSLADRAQRLTILDHDREAMRSLGNQRQSLSDRRMRESPKRRCRRPDAIASTLPTTSATTSVGMSCGRIAIPPRRATVSSHAPARNRGHVGDDDRQRDADPIGAAQVDVRRDPTAERLGTMKTSE